VTWGRFEHDMPRNPKIAGLSDTAFRVWIEATLWSVGALTNGVLPSTVSTSVWTTVSRPKSAIKELLNAGVFEVEPEGYFVHDFGEYQEHPDQVKERREAARQRMRHLRAARGQS